MTIKNSHDLAVYSVNVEIARLAEDKMSKDIAVLDVEIEDEVLDLSTFH
jgi:hypothetical protein